MLPVPIYFQSGKKLAEKVVPAVREQFLEATANGFVNLTDFREYYARHNPISSLAGKQGVSGSFGFGYFYNANPETVERHWASLLMEFFRGRLLP
ncbi:MAG: hypothetical protein R3344_14455, partial [Acidobacteriota bacterium]|nr:hypothetical protein [Acidobacteriota bacterium]